MNGALFREGDTKEVPGFLARNRTSGQVAACGLIANLRRERSPEAWGAGDIDRRDTAQEGLVLSSSGH